ncbi:transglycosylase SLT domain-containing protein [Streptococcus parauberis]|uniref:transglycosylase SLT domain-containing protein n=1 Tax=Streptococcus parauberis TaxID=1348 RepID=UPI000CCE0041|nr:transglycosylase SLT domain-containing protein [Streptococcus parauberis]PNY18654.1 putative transglycosylase IsaA precursor [Streptococcus parauberis]
MYRIKNLKKSYVSFGVLAFAIGLLALVFTFSSKNVDTESFAKKSETKVVKKVTKSKVEKSSSSSEKKKPEASSSQTEQSSSIEATAATPAEVAPATEETVPAEQVQAAPVAPAQATQVQQYASTPAYPSNGNTAGVVGSQAAAQMAAATGVPQATWEAIIARESNGNPNVANASGASGLFQTMPGWGSTATVQDQVNSAIKAYNTQGMSAWGY